MPGTGHKSEKCARPVALDKNVERNGGDAGLVAKSCLALATPWTVTCQAPPSLGFSRQEYWSGLPFPCPIHESEK